MSELRAPTVAGPAQIAVNPGVPTPSNEALVAIIEGIEPAGTVLHAEFICGPRPGRR